VRHKHLTVLEIRKQACQLSPVFVLTIKGKGVMFGVSCDGALVCAKPHGGSEIVYEHRIGYSYTPCFPSAVSKT